MKQIKRWTSSITASFDWIISQMENHDAVVLSAIKEMQEALVKARVQLRRVEEDGKKVERKLQESEQASLKWRERAKNLKESDPDSALECLARHKRSAAEVSHLSEELSRHEEFRSKLAEDIRVAATRIEDLRRKRNQMKARATRADAFKATEENSCQVVSEIDDIFDRWELQVAKSEVYVEPEDTFEANFKKDEEKASLQAELEAL